MAGSSTGSRRWRFPTSGSWRARSSSSLPISRTETKIFTLLKRPIGQPRRRALYDGKRWSELTEAEHREHPGDYEAQVGQGPVTIHSEENLASSDKGVTMFRHLFRRQVRAVAEGRSPVGVTDDPEQATFGVRAGNYIGDRADVIELG